MILPYLCHFLQTSSFVHSGIQSSIEHTEYRFSYILFSWVTTDRVCAWWWKRTRRKIFLIQILRILFEWNTKMANAVEEWKMLRMRERKRPSHPHCRSLLRSLSFFLVRRSSVRCALMSALSQQPIVIQPVKWFNIFIFMWLFLFREFVLSIGRVFLLLFLVSCFGCVFFPFPNFADRNLFVCVYFKELGSDYRANRK